jgi:hypothetical protein
MDEFTRQYIETALWSSTDSESVPLDANYTADDLAADTLAAMAADCNRFQAEAGDRIADDPGRAGHDFWLTRNGHGAGFWDGDWPESDGDWLSELSRRFGEVDLYIGDDGQVHQD